MHQQTNDEARKKKRCRTLSDFSVQGEQKREEEEHGLSTKEVVEAREDGRWKCTSRALGLVCMDWMGEGESSPRSTEAVGSDQPRGSPRSHPRGIFV